MKFDSGVDKYVQQKSENFNNSSNFWWRIGFGERIASRTNVETDGLARSAYVPGCLANKTKAFDPHDDETVPKFIVKF